MKTKRISNFLLPPKKSSFKWTIKFSSNEFLSLYEINVNVNNLISIDIYYENLEYTSISQLPKMDIIDLISNIGSNLSLFIGISFLSFAEIIEIIGEILIILFQKKQPVRYY